MMTIGVDAHKATHTAVALTEVGRKVGEITVPATTAGHVELMVWAEGFADRQWAIEDCRHVTSHLEAHLVDLAERAVRVPPKLTGPSRRSQRTQGKSDPVDAEAVGRAALAHPDLPVATIPTPEMAALRAVDSYRTQAVSARTELISRLRWRLHALDPTFSPENLDTYKHLDLTKDRLESHQGAVGDIARRELERIRALTVEINETTSQLRKLITATGTTLTTIEGCAELTAATILIRVEDIRRFGTEAQFGAYAATAPIPASSGNTSHMRLNRTGDRQLNKAIHTIAITQMRCHPPAIEFIANKTEGGKTKRDAIRALKRHITRRVYRQLTNELT